LKALIEINLCLSDLFLICLKECVLHNLFSYNI
jgi:hypothetical protein